MSVTFEGKTYPLCCSGCKDEFQDKPAKYVKKAMLQASNPGKTSKASQTNARNKDDGSFGGLVEDENANLKEDKEAASSKTKPTAKTKAKESPEPEREPAAPTKPKTKRADRSVKAASLLKQAQALEKAGKSSAALTYYKRIVAEFPDAPQAATALARIKARAEK